MAEKQAVKEGTKKAQSFSSIHKLGGLVYFCSIIDGIEGDINLLNKVMQSINNDKKARQWGKFLISSNDDVLVAQGHVPSELSKEKGLDIKEWTKKLMSFLPHADLLEINDEFSKFEMRVGSEEEIFPFKLCDDMIQNNVHFLKTKGLIQDVKEESEDEGGYADEAGIEW